jgi:hypothetical protein
MVTDRQVRRFTEIDPERAYEGHGNRHASQLSLLYYLLPFDVMPCPACQPPALEILCQSFSFEALLS